MDSASLQHLIQTGMPEATVQVSGEDGVHFEALIVSDAFAGKLPLARHRMVYATLRPVTRAVKAAISPIELTDQSWQKS